MKSITIGVDLGDKNSVVCEMNDRVEIIGNHRLENTEKSLRSFFSTRIGATVVLEAGSHSPWISRLLSTIGCAVLVGNPRKLRAIWERGVYQLRPQAKL